MVSVTYINTGVEVHTHPQGQNMDGAASGIRAERSSQSFFAVLHLLLFHRDHCSGENTLWVSVSGSATEVFFFFSFFSNH